VEKCRHKANSKGLKPATAIRLSIHLNNSCIDSNNGRTIVRQFLYPAFLSASFSGSLLDQFGFKPTRSTTGALIAFLYTVTNLLAINPYVCIIALDFSKAFDTVRHSTLLEKMAKLEIPDHVYNWLVDFFHGHAHCTQYNGVVSALHEITASLIQGSSIGPLRMSLVPQT
jgi:hypothetical protein